MISLVNIQMSINKVICSHNACAFSAVFIPSNVKYANFRTSQSIWNLDVTTISHNLAIRH